MGLRANDLESMVYEVIEIDSYKSKMGEDKDIVTVCFSVKEKEAARDLEKFLEGGYNYVLDADSTPGEQTDGTYKVFVEIERTRHVPEQIIEMTSDVTKLADVEFKYRYHKNFRSEQLTQENLNNHIPLSSNDYEGFIQESSMNNYKEFFNKSFLEYTSMVNETLVIKKPYGDILEFKVLDFGPIKETMSRIHESFNANDFAEIIFLSKYIGDYNITKYAHKLTFENDNNMLVVERKVV